MPQKEAKVFRPLPSALPLELSQLRNPAPIETPNASSALKVP
jgi:hypothetical protein